MVTGCEEANVIYCFVCTITKQPASPYNTTGVTNVDGLKKTLDSHEASINHGEAIMDFKHLGKRGTVLDFFDKRSKVANEIKSREHKRNIKYTMLLFRCVLFFGKQGFSFRGKIERTSSDNSGNFREFIYLQALENDTIKEVLNKYENCYLSAEIQNEMIQICSESIDNEIRYELEKTNFVSVITDETTDYAKKGVLIIVFKYVYMGGVKERFISLIDISGNKTADFISNQIINTINSYKIQNKILSQCYDGPL